MSRDNTPPCQTHVNNTSSTIRRWSMKMSRWVKLPGCSVYKTEVETIKELNARFKKTLNKSTLKKVLIAERIRLMKQGTFHLKKKTI